MTVSRTYFTRLSLKKRMMLKAKHFHWYELCSRHVDETAKEPLQCLSTDCQASLMHQRYHAWRLHQWSTLLVSNDRSVWWDAPTWKLHYECLFEVRHGNVRPRTKHLAIVILCLPFLSYTNGASSYLSHCSLAIFSASNVILGILARCNDIPRVLHANR